MKRVLSAIFAVMLMSAGCGKSPPGDAPIPVNVPSPGQVTLETAAVDQSAKVLLSKIRTGTIIADEITIDFRKVIGEPLTPFERDRGYSDSAALDWLKHTAGQLQTDSLKPIAISDAVATYELDSGTLRIIRVEKQWQLDWFHTGRPKSAAPLTGDDGAKRFAVSSLLDPLFTGNYDLAEAVLTDPTKATLAPPFGRDTGFNKGTLRTKLRGLLNGANGYAVQWNGPTATVTLNGSESRKLIITVGPATRPGVMLVQSLDVNE